MKPEHLIASNYACYADLLHWGAVTNLKRSGYIAKQFILARFMSLFTHKLPTWSFQDVSLCFKLDLDDLPCPVLDSSFRYLQVNSCVLELYDCTCRLMSLSPNYAWVFTKDCCSFCCDFVTAAALFYLAELVEEYTVLAAKVIKGMLVVSRSSFAVFVCVKYLL